MRYKTLENLSIKTLSSLFNHAFADYFVNIELTAEILKEKIQAEDIKLNKSVGAFSDKKPVGFIFHAVREINGEKVAYNAGKGVLPEFRGNGLTKKMYNFLLPVLDRDGVKKIVLEVMEQNTPAIKTYSGLGFKKTSNLECFKGKVQIESTNNEVVFKNQKNEKIRFLKNYWDWNPTWQHDIKSVVQSSKYETFCGYLNRSLVCYAVSIPKTGRIAQFAVNPKYRKMKIGTALFNYISKMTPEGISLINVDGNSIDTIRI